MTRKEYEKTVDDIGLELWKIENKSEFHGVIIAKLCDMWADNEQSFYDELVDKDSPQ